MPLPTAITKIIASGAWAQIRVRESSGSPLKVIGMVTDASYQENFNLQDANVVGHLGPISIDSQGYSCSVSIGTYVPEKKEQGGGYADGGDTTVTDLLPTRSDIQFDGKGKTFEYMDFYNKATGEVLNAFSHVIVADNGSRVGPNAYITKNISLRAIERTI